VPHSVPSSRAPRHNQSARNALRRTALGIAFVATLSSSAFAQQALTDAATFMPACRETLTVCDRQAPVGQPTGVLRAAIATTASEMFDGKEMRAEGEATSAEKTDTRFQIVLGSFITAAGTDIALSMYAIGQGTAREVGFGAAWQHSPVAFAVTKSALTALYAFELQKLHKSRPKTAMVLGIIGTAIETSLVARTARLMPSQR